MKFSKNSRAAHCHAFRIYRVSETSKEEKHDTSFKENIYSLNLVVTNLVLSLLQNIINPLRLGNIFFLM